MKQPPYSYSLWRCVLVVTLSALSPLPVSSPKSLFYHQIRLPQLCRHPLEAENVCVCARLKNLRLHAGDRFVSSSQCRAGNISKKLFRSRWHFFGAVWLPFLVLTRSGTRAKSLAVDWRKSGRSIRILWDMKPTVAPGRKGRRARSITMLTNCGRGLGTDDNIRTLNNLFASLALLLYKWFL